MEEEKKYQLIEDYLSEKLDDVSMENVTIKLKEDPLFAQEVQLHKELADTFQNDEVNQFRQTLNQINKDSKEGKTKIFSIRQRNIILGLAATIALFFGSQMIFNRTISSTELFSQNFEKYPLVFNNRSNNSTAAVLNKATQAYNNDDFDKAATLFDELLISNPKNYSFQFYKAIALLSNKQAEEAQPIFKEIIKVKPLCILNKHSGTWR